MLSAPRVVLIGWGNSLLSQLVVYERLYQSFGLETKSVIPSTPLGLVHAAAYARALAPIADDLAKEAGARPVFVHIFSDNGFIGWAALLDALDRTASGRRAKEAIAGVVYDSAPGLWNVRGPLDFARRFALGITPAIARAANLGVRERLPFVTPALAAAFLGYQVVFRRSVANMRSSGDRVARKQPRCPHLFLFGEDDILVSPGDVRAWIDRERAAGLDIESHAFPSARHVALYPKDPRRYRSAIRAFVERANGNTA